MTSVRDFIAAQLARVWVHARALHGLFATERALAAVGERGISAAVRAGADDVERTSELGAGDVIEEEHGAALAADPFLSQRDPFFDSIRSLPPFQRLIELVRDRWQNFEPT
jgi:hypothetical protein